MKKILIILILLISNFVFGQNQNIPAYFNYINQAELAIVNNDYKSGLKYYEKAFKNHDEPFNYDYQNALLCSCQLEKKQSVKAYFIALKQREVDLENIEKKCVQNMGETYWNELKQLNISITIDTIYRQKLEEVLSKDQSIRYYSLQKNPNNHYAHNGDTIRFVDSLNLLELERFIDEKGFPTEAVVGSYFGFYLSIKHNQQWKRNDFDSILYEQVLRGGFSPYVYAFLHDYWVDNFDKGRLTYRVETAYLINGKMYFDYWKTESDIDSLRSEIYMESVSEQREKIKSDKKAEGFSFHGGGYVAILSGLDDMMANRLISGFEESRINYENSKKNDTHTERKTQKKNKRGN
jgi:hypothetical protein